MENDKNLNSLLSALKEKKALRKGEAATITVRTNDGKETSGPITKVGNDYIIVNYSRNSRDNFTIIPISSMSSVYVHVYCQKK